MNDPLNADQWYHMKIMKQDNIMSFYFEGSLIYSWDLSTTDIPVEAMATILDMDVIR